MSEPPPRPVVLVLCSSDRPPPPHMEPVEERADVRYVDADGLADAVVDAHALFLWDFFSGALEDAWPRAGSLSWVHVAAAGVDTLLFDDLRRSSVVVTNARGVFDRPIAEFVLASILAHAKDLHRSHDLQTQRTWQHRETQALADSTALVIGTGAIGRETARLLRACGMQVRGAGRTAREGDADFGTVVASSELAEHVGWADHVVVLAPLTDATRDLVDATLLSRMKPTAHLVNVARGPIVDEDALVAALKAGGIAGASLDVFRTEPLPADHALWSTRGVAVSAHMSGDVVGWTNTLARQFVDNALRWLDGEELLNVVDKELGFSRATTDGKTARD